MKTPNKKLADKSPRPNAEVYAEYLRERIYGSITLAGINLGLLLGVNHISVNHAFTTVITTSLGLWSASLFAEIVSYRVMHEKPMARGEIIHHVIVHRGILVAALPTIVLLTFSALELISLRAALTTDIVLALIGLGVIVIRSAATTTNNLITALITVILQAGVAATIITLKLFSH
jgi:hypothetical protein